MFVVLLKAAEVVVRGCIVLILVVNTPAVPVDTGPFVVAASVFVAMIVDAVLCNAPLSASVISDAVLSSSIGVVIGSSVCMVSLGEASAVCPSEESVVLAAVLGLRGDVDVIGDSVLNVVADTWDDELNAAPSDPASFDTSSDCASSDSEPVCASVGRAVLTEAPHSLQPALSVSSEVI